MFFCGFSPVYSNTTGSPCTEVTAPSTVVQVNSDAAGSSTSGVFTPIQQARFVDYVYVSLFTSECLLV